MTLPPSSSIATICKFTGKAMVHWQSEDSDSDWIDCKYTNLLLPFWNETKEKEQRIRFGGSSCLQDTENGPVAQNSFAIIDEPQSTNQDVNVPIVSYLDL